MLATCRDCCVGTCSWGLRDPFWLLFFSVLCQGEFLISCKTSSLAARRLPLLCLAGWLAYYQDVFALPLDVASHFCFAFGLVPIYLPLPFSIPCRIIILPIPMVMILLLLVPPLIFPLGVYQVGFQVLLPRLPIIVGVPRIF